jgi:hypothetical protein
MRSTTLAVLAVAATGALSLPAAGQRPGMLPHPMSGSLTVCVEQHGAYLANVSAEQVGYVHIFRWHHMPVGQRQCGKADAIRGTKVIFTAEAFTGFNNQHACRFELTVPETGSRIQTIRLGGTTFHPNCNLS